MAIIFTPNGTLNVAHDPSDLPESGNGTDLVSGAMVRCKNLRLNETGKARTRDGSTKLNSTPIDSEIWWIEEQGGDRYTFAGDSIYENESAIETGLTSAQWSAIQYNAFNDTQNNIFALNGTDTKRIEGGGVYPWGIEAPMSAPTIRSGQGTGLTGVYRATYTYVRKVGDAVVAESDPSPSSEPIALHNQSLSADVIQPTDPQVTHIRFYRTLANGLVHYFDQEIEVYIEYGYGYCFDWEENEGRDVTPAAISAEYGVSHEWEGDSYLDGGAYQFTYEDESNNRDITYTWEANYTASGSWSASLPSTVYGSSAISSTITASATVTVSNANGTPSYTWSKLYGAAISLSASGATATFTANGVGPGLSRSAVFQCIVTDSPNSAVLTTEVTLERLS